MIDRVVLLDYCNAFSLADLGGFNVRKLLFESDISDEDFSKLVAGLCRYGP